MSAADPNRTGETARDIGALIALIERWTSKRFRWGRDCVRFGFDAVEAQTGIDPAPGLRWRSKRAALALIAAEGGLVAALDRRFDRVPLALARRGDLAGVPEPGEIGLRIMVIEGANMTSPGARGLERQSRGAMTIAWNAGRVKPHG